MGSVRVTGRFGTTEPGHYLFPFGKPVPHDPTRAITDISSAWDTLRKAAEVECRLHDLRHTAATKMAEGGIPESTMLALMGHMSRAMLERYSHIRMRAKRQAVESVTLAVEPIRKPLEAGISDGVSTISTTVPEPGRIQ